jgi:hypothetical protein
MPFHPPWSRRQLIRAGLAGVASLTEVLALRARDVQPGQTPRDTAVILVLQEGGASQLETWDPKPDADDSIRGEFGAIATRVPGVRFSEVLPRQANIMDKLTVLRSVHHSSTQHSSSVHLIKTGYYCRAESEINEMPSMGSYVARIRGANRAGMPPYALLYAGTRYDGGHFLGHGYNPFLIRSTPDNPAMQIPPGLTLLDGITDEQWRDRRRLLAKFDTARRVLDTRAGADSMSHFRQQAYEMVTNPHAQRAFNLDAEPAPIRNRYGRNVVGERLLLARRLVEHGITWVTVGTFDWDHHIALWDDMRRDAPRFDQGVAALIEDLHMRGLQEKVLVVVLGEFGRTPRFEFIGRNKPGRDHWGAAMSVLLAGGGLRGGQVIGATDRHAEQPIQCPIRIERVLATMYRHLGIDPATTFVDHTGRPRNLLEIREPIQELG